MRVEALLWDFGDTLVDEHWMHVPPVGCPRWPDAWAEVMETYAGAWNTGEVSERDIFSALSARTGLDVEAVAEHAARCCESIRFHPFAWRVVMERRAPQALVTVNPDLFVTRVCTVHHLVEYFDTLVVSCLEGTDDKVQLCETACDRLGVADPRHALLIDNRRDLTDAWELRGGIAYWYRGDEMFRADIAVLLGE